MSGTDDRHWDRIVNLSMFIQKRWHERFTYCTVVISLNNLMCWVFFLFPYNSCCNQSIYDCVNAVDMTV